MTVLALSVNDGGAAGYARDGGGEGAAEGRGGKGVLRVEGGLEAPEGLDEAGFELHGFAVVDEFGKHGDIKPGGLRKCC